MKAASIGPFVEVAAAAQACQWDQARAALARIQRILHPRLTPQWHAWRYRAATFWWTPLQGGGVVLRRTRADDADFYRACFADPGFASRYNRQPPWTGDLARALERTGRGSPVDLGAMHWIVCDGAERRLGLATLSSINVANRRAEFSIGFPQQRQVLSSAVAGHGIKTTLMVFQFAFFVAALNKLTAYIYRGNDEALRNARHVGFEIEGLLKEHFFLPPGEFVDVHALGLTRTQLLANADILRVARRRLGLQWPGTPNRPDQPAM